jgi:chemotaxis protein MotB
MIRSRKYISPRVVKRVIRVEEPQHRAQWKVAYADFVTAMMAFFLLLWILAATTPIQREEIADYFRPSMGLGDERGVGFKGGLKATEEGKQEDSLMQVGLVHGQVRQGSAPDNWVNQTGKEEKEADFAANIVKPIDFTDPEGNQHSLMEGVNQALRNDPELRKHKQEILLQETPEGLKIDIIDDIVNPVFEHKKAELTPAGKKALSLIAKMLAMTPNPIALYGHMESPVRKKQKAGEGIWELSINRANAVRRFLTSGLLDEKRITHVVGMADKQLLVPQKPSSPRNRRVTIMVANSLEIREKKPSVALAPVEQGEKKKTIWETFRCIGQPLKRITTLNKNPCMRGTCRGFNRAGNAIRIS